MGTCVCLWIVCACFWQVPFLILHSLPHPSLCQVCLQNPQSQRLPERGENSLRSSSILRGVSLCDADGPIVCHQGSELDWEVKIYSRKVWKAATGDLARYLDSLRKRSSCPAIRNKLASEIEVWPGGQSFIGTPSPTTENMLVGMEDWLVWEKMRPFSPTPPIPQLQHWLN